MPDRSRFSVHENPHADLIAEPTRLASFRRRDIGLTLADENLPPHMPEVGFDAMLYLKPPDTHKSTPTNYDERVRYLYNTSVASLDERRWSELFGNGRVPELEPVVLPNDDLRNLRLYDCVAPVRLWREEPKPFTTWSQLIGAVSSLMEEMEPIARLWKDLHWSQERRLRVYTPVPDIVRPLLHTSCHKLHIDLGMDAPDTMWTYHQ